MWMEAGQGNEHRRYQVLELFKCSRDSLSGRTANLHYWNPWVSTERRRMLRKEVKAWVQCHPILQNNSPSFKWETKASSSVGIRRRWHLALMTRILKGMFHPSNTQPGPDQVHITSDVFFSQYPSIQENKGVSEIKVLPRTWAHL